MRSAYCNKCQEYSSDFLEVWFEGIIYEEPKCRKCGTELIIEDFDGEEWRKPITMEELT